MRQNRYKHTLQCLALTLATLMMANAKAYAQQQTIPVYDAEGALGCVVIVDSIRLSQQDGAAVGLTLKVAVTDNELAKTDLVVLKPRLVTPTDSVDFPQMQLYGKWAYIHLLRSGKDTGTGDVMLPASAARNPLSYSQHVDYEPWMDQAELKIIVSQMNGCGAEYLNNSRSIGERHMVLKQREILKQTAAKVDHLEGRAYINFASAKTAIDPSLGNNQRELDNLNHVLDSLRHEANMDVRQIFLKGYASPEGPYALNEKLSKDRVESLRQYLADHYDIPADLISVDNEPEDWEGLRDYVSKSDLPDRAQIMKIIDSKADPDDKLARIVKQHPAAYQQLLKVVFPLLRHTDYRVSYTITKGQDTEYSEFALDTNYVYSATINKEALLPDVTYAPETYKPLLAVKTNLLYDVLLAPNIELEVPLGRYARWSVMAEYTNPWWRWSKLDHSYQIQEGGLELRRWLFNGCDDHRPCLSGHFLGAYAAVAKYDLEYDQSGDQGELFSAGLTYGYSWPLASHWNLELSASAGVAFGERRHYNAEFESTHLIYKYTRNTFYAGPTKLKVSLVYLLGKKGGKR